MAARTYLEVYKEHRGFVSHKYIHYFFIFSDAKITEANKPESV